MRWRTQRRRAPTRKPVQAAGAPAGGSRPHYAEDRNLLRIHAVIDTSLLSALAIGGKEMPFSSLKDPVELARAQAALEAAWKAVATHIPEALAEQERTRLAYIVANLVALSMDEDDLMQRSIDQYRRSP